MGLYVPATPLSPLVAVDDLILMTMSLLILFLFADYKSSVRVKLELIKKTSRIFWLV